MRTLGIDGSAGGGLDPRRVRRVVAVGMGDENMRHRLAAHGVEQRLGVRFVVGAGIDDRDLALADDVTDRAGEGERARIVAENASHAGAGFIDDTRLEREVAVERDVVVVGHGISSVISGFSLTSSCPGLSRASTSFLASPKTWMAGTSPAMTELGLSRAGRRRHFTKTPECLLSPGP